MASQEISMQKIQNQLETILNSNNFSASDRFRQFLKFIVEETLAGRERELKAYTIATQVFGRDKNFDPLLDPVVRVEAAKLRNKLEQFYLRRKGQGKDTVHITIPKGSYVPCFEPIEESLTSAPDPDDDFAEDEYVPDPADEWDPPQVDFDAGDDGDEPDIKKSTQENISAELYYKDTHQKDVRDVRMTPPLQAEIAPTVAILPFSNISSSQEIDHLLSGLAEELAIALTKFEDLKIISAHAMNIDLAATSDPNALSYSLGARFILYGSAQLDTNIIRVRVKLADTATHTTLWAEKFDEPYTATALFEIIDTTVAQVAARIGDSFGYIKRTLLSEAPSQRTGNIVAFEAILYYHHWAANLEEDRFIKAKDALDKAIEADPRYCLAYAMLADIYAVHYQWNYNLFPNDLKMLHELSQRAVELAPHCQYAQWSKAYSCYLSRDKDQFVRLARLAVSINPADTNITAAAGQKLAMAGNWEEGIDLIKKAEYLNPFLPSWFRAATFTYHLHNNNLEEALSEARRISTPSIAGPMFITAVLGVMGRNDEAAIKLKKLEERFPNFSNIYEELLNRIFFQEPLIKLLAKGLKAAGV